MAETTLHREISAFSDAHFAVYNIAHVALEECSLSDDTLHWLINEYIPNNRADYVRSHSREGATEQGVDEVVAFLEYLLTIPEDDRECYTEEDDND